MEKDHLPFSNCIIQIAEGLKSAPQPEKFKINLSSKFSIVVFTYF